MTTKLNGFSPLFYKDPMDFLKLWDNRSTLTIPANRTFTIKNIGPFVQSYGVVTDGAEVYPTTPLGYMVYLLNKIVALSGKNLNIQSEVDSGEIRLGANLSFKSSVSVTITSADENPVAVRLTDFLRLMITYSLQCVKFAPDKNFVIIMSSAESESYVEKPIAEIINTVLTPRIPTGFSAQLLFCNPKAGQRSITSGRVNLTSSDLVELRGIVFSCNGGIELVCRPKTAIKPPLFLTAKKESSNEATGRIISSVARDRDGSQERTGSRFYFATPGAFFNFWEKSRSLKIPSNQSFTIKNVRLLIETSFESLDGAEKCPADPLDKMAYFLNKMLALCGKTVAVVLNSKGTLQLEIDQDLHFQYSGSLVLNITADNPICVRLTDLFHAMIVRSQTSLKIPPNKQLVVILPQKEQVFYQRSAKEIVDAVITPRIPEAFDVDLLFSKPIVERMITYGKFDGNLGHDLTVIGVSFSCNGGMELTCVRKKELSLRDLCLDKVRHSLPSQLATPNIDSFQPNLDPDHQA